MVKSLLVFDSSRRAIKSLNNRGWARQRRAWQARAAVRSDDLGEWRNICSQSSSGSRRSWASVGIFDMYILEWYRISVVYDEHKNTYLRQRWV